MAKKLSKQNKEGLEINLGKITKTVIKGVRGLFNLALDLEKEGKSNYEEVGEICGKTGSGKEYRGSYGFRLKVGIDPEELRRNRRKLDDNNKVAS